MNILNCEKNTRKIKLIQMKKKGFSFPNQFKKNKTLKDIRSMHEKKTCEELKVLNLYYSVAGRIIQKRIMGKASFFTLQEIDVTIQLYITEKKNVKQCKYANYKTWDIGDIIGTKGLLFKTKTDELSIFCTELYILNKSLKPLPDKFHGLSNQEKRYRQRYLDFISNKNLFSIFQNRSDIIMHIRNFMVENKFLEVETPMLHNIPGGATARPFVTYHNKLDAKMYLRIAPELYLKQLVIAGFERIFEINRNFRNEGISARHNPEFTMMEAYMAYSNHEDMMILLEKLCKYIAICVFNNTNITYDTYHFDFNKPFYRFSMKEAIIKFNPDVHINDFQNLEKMRNIARKAGIEINYKWKIGQIENEIFEKTVEKKLIQPTFITQYPVEVSPLARRNDHNLHVTDRFELFIAGYEISNGFSELNDVDDQKKRFLDQTNDIEKENSESIFFDTNYIEALNYGLPPTSGIGIGIDRLIMIFTNQKSIRDVILFPTLRTKK